MGASDHGGAVPEVRLRLAGTFAVYRDGSRVAAEHLGSRKARILLKLLAALRTRTVPVERITEVLWDGAPPAAPAGNVATLVSRLRRVLGAAIIEGGRDGYRLGRSPAVHVDLDEVDRWATEAERRFAAEQHALAVTAATRADALLGAGTVLEDEHSAEWAEEARTEHGELSKRVRRVLAEAALATGELCLAARAAAQTVSGDPYDERARRALMRIHADGGELAKALATYSELRELLQSELGADPAPETQALYLRLLRDGRSPASEPAPAEARAGRDRPGLVGRAGELERLCQAWNEAADGRPRLALVSGEAGIGKTRLAGELIEIARTTGGTVLMARCYATESSLFLQPVVDAIAAAVRSMSAGRLRELAGEHAGVLAQLVPEVASVFGPTPGIRPRGADIERRRAFEAVSAFVAALADRGPVLLSLDDLQNGGRATVELLHYLIRRLPHGRLLAVATVRAEEGAEVLDSLADIAFRVELGPLSADAVSVLAVAAGQGGQAGSISRRTRGHTLFVVETLRALAAGNPGAPETLDAAVLARVNRAGDEVETMLRAAAVLGASIDLTAVAALLGTTTQAVMAWCAQAHRARLLVVADRDYEFANDIVREVLYATTPAPARCAYHLHAARLLTARPEAMAAHASMAGDWPRSSRGWLIAGGQALARAAAADAVDLLTRSVEAAARTGDDEVKARALLVRGRAKEAVVDFEGATADIEAAVGLSHEAGDQRMEMAGLLALGGDASVARGLPLADAVRPLERGLTIASLLSDRAMEANLRARLAILDANRLRFDEAVEQGRLAVRAARASRDQEALAAALDGQKTALAYLGDVDALAPVVAELEPLVRRLGDLYRLHWVLLESAFPALAAGRWPEVITRIEAALDVHRRSGYGAHAGWHISLLGTVARIRGRYAEAIAIGRRAVAVSEQVPHAWTRAVAGAALGTTLLEAGAVDESIAVLERARAAVTKEGAAALHLRCLAPLALATGSAELLTEAAALLEEIRAPDDAAVMTVDGCYVAVARAWSRHGEPERARMALAPLLRTAARVPWVGPLAEASLADGQAAASLGLAAEAVASFERAAELGRHHGMPRIVKEATSAFG